MKTYTIVTKILQTTKELANADQRRRQQFKEYEMEKHKIAAAKSDGRENIVNLTVGLLVTGKRKMSRAKWRPRSDATRRDATRRYAILPRAYFVLIRFYEPVDSRR